MYWLFFRMVVVFLGGFVMVVVGDGWMDGMWG